MKVFSPFLNGNTTTSGSFNVPNHPTSSAIINPTTGSLYHDTTDSVLKVYTGTQWQIVGEQEVVLPSTDIEYLLVAGAGGGGGGSDTGGYTGGGGGGAGGYISSSLSSILSGSSFSITIGAGGTGGPFNTTNNVGTDGGNSSINSDILPTLSVIGGGGGGAGGDDTNPTRIGKDGGSGGGSGYRSLIGGSGTIGQGTDGGHASSGEQGSGGGGGAFTPGVDGTDSPVYYTGGSGGNGYTSQITGMPIAYAGGGGAGGLDLDAYDPNGGDGGNGGGGTGGYNPSTPSVYNGTNGEANKGAGGGGGTRHTVSNTGGSGGSGVAIFAYDSGSINAAGGIIGDAGNGRKYNQFNTSGTFKVGSTSDFGIVTDSLQINLDAGNFTSRGTSTWTDLSGNANNASVINAVLDQDFYYSLDGNSDYFSVPYNSSFNSATFTTETWVKFDNFSRYHHLMCYFVEVTGQRVFYMRSYTNTAGLQLGVLDSSNVTQSLLSNTTNLSTGTWYHIVGTADGVNLKIYINGNLDSSAAQTVSVTTGATNRPMRIGNLEGYEGTYDLAGDIAQSRYYTKALTATEVLQNYNATKTNFI